MIVADLLQALHSLLMDEKINCSTTAIKNYGVNKMKKYFLFSLALILVLSNYSS